MRKENNSRDYMEKSCSLVAELEISGSLIWLAINKWGIFFY